MKSNSLDSASSTYHISDRRAYIRILRRMLGLGGGARLDGEFRERVSAVQSRGGISTDGIVDYATFLLILAEYRAPVPVRLKLYDVGDEIVRLNANIASLIKHYDLSLRPPRGRVFGVDGLRAQYRLREIYGLAPLDFVDGELLRRIERDIRSINAKTC